MNATPPGMGELARRLLSFEAKSIPRSDGNIDDAVRVCERLRVPFSKLAGVYGFTSLLSRAVAMAKREDPSLEAIQVRPDGSLEGRVEAGIVQEGTTGGEVLVARFLGLLVTFIGETLTLHLVRDAWPDLPDDGSDRSKGAGS